MEGDVVTDATQAFGQFASAAEVSMTMNAEGAKQWKRLTAENIGKSVAIVLDGYVYSYPTVQAEIAGGRSQITGNFTVNEAKDLANILKSGKLPAPARIIEEAIVGPSLGEEAINSGLTSFIFALLLAKEKIPPCPPPPPCILLIIKNQNTIINIHGENWKK